MLRPFAPSPVRPNSSAVRGLGVALVLLVAARPAPAQEPAADATRAARLGWHRQLATKDALEFERSLAAAGAGRAADVSLDRVGNARLLSDELQAALTDRKFDPRPALADLADKARTRVLRAEDDWAAAFRNRAAFERHVDAEQARYGFDYARNTPPEFRLTLLDAGAVVWAALAFAVGLRLARHEDRVDARRRRRGRLALAGCAAGLLASGGCAGPALTAPWDARETERLTRETRDAADQVSALRAAADADRAATVAGWAKVLGSRTPEAKRWADAFAAEETGTREAVRGILTDARMAERLADEAAADREKLPADRAKLADLVSASRVRSALYTGLRVVAGLALTALAFAPLYRTRRRRRKWLANEARVCPRCLARDRLTERRPDAVDARYQEAGSFQCGECGYRFRKSYAKLPRLCFPTVGIRASGKTHMLVTGYDKVRNGNAPTDAAIQPAPSMGDDEFEALINLVLRDQASAGATGHHQLPNPIIVHARDADPAGESTVLVNLFDYGGEMVQQTLDTDLLRQRAVLMDGFMMFVDPTQLYGGRGGIRLEDQIKAMNDFYQDMREARGIEVGRPIPLPVAVCIPKFDLLVSDNPIRGLSVPYIHKLLAELNPPGPLTLDVIEERSAVVEEMIPMMFPGFDLRKRFHEFFGGQVMFFPMSSVSLAERELGEKDLRRRQLAPWGVVEPVLWLLHMHGYQVLGSGR